MTDSALTNQLRTVLARTPEWLRQDLAASDPAGRERAVETLAAMLALALQEPSEPGCAE